ncbi:uncharacterized protein PpBr36_06029 [Pyricularia pennisetigena]|uniref:uncharacterized protein n=1 Tax=Pyricularia pennisetigena TaxID=1578925 RepID=UPI001153A573|nr:uncharacterized protein PpBr36_06029 [Pyricularia pennisetigena]TLS22714.1 hypothetical protein PpBr36_06029 [Pyricularia pennisetigena]
MDPLEARQLIPATSDDEGRTSRARLCQAVNLPANGALVMSNGEVITLTAPAAFKPACAPNTTPAIVAGPGGTTGAGVDDAAQVGPQFSDLSDPFYASTFPQCYALAATTVISYTLVIMLVITPRSFLDGGIVVLGRRGFTSGGSGHGIIGGRPWLQKVAALTVAISLTIATADTFKVAEQQYAFGLQNARELQDKVLNGTELKIIRIISDTFLWLAQAQTLIRLFPRQREKVIIKWTAFALITFDLIFDSLNSFQFPGPGNSRPGSFTDAIPALSYLFQLALGVLYAAWVIYYSLMKKKYAYYHPQMKNICFVAGLSLLSILVPVVFFILDISKPEFTGWGDYVRWVGAAAASVIVWEWVERIEALEREEKRNGILGREVFDGDEMLETDSDATWPQRSRATKGSHGDGDDDDDDGEGGRRIAVGDGAGRRRARRANGSHDRFAADSGRGRNHAQLWTSITSRYRSRPNNGADVSTAEKDNIRQTSKNVRPAAARFLQPPLWPARPPPAATPVSRTDTASADSTVYAIRYHPLTDVHSRTTTRPTPPPQLSTERQPAVGDVSSTNAAVEDGRSHDQPSGSQSASPSPPRDQQSPGPQNLVALSREETRRERRQSLATTSRTGTRAGADSEEPSASSQQGGESSRGSESTATKGWRVLTQTLPFRGGSTRSAEDSSDSQSTASKSRSKLQVSREGKSDRWDIRNRMEDFAVTQAERIRERIRPTPDTDSLPVTVIPAPARRGAALAQLLEEDESRQGSGRAQPQDDERPILASPTLPSSSQRRNSIGPEPLSSNDDLSDWHIPPPAVVRAASRANISRSTTRDGPPEP